MTEETRTVPRQIAAGIILDEWRRISAGAEKARDAGLGDLADLQAETASILSGLFRQLAGRYPNEVRS